MSGFVEAVSTCSRQVPLGIDADENTVFLDIDKLIESRMLITATSGGGKPGGHSRQRRVHKSHDGPKGKQADGCYSI